MLRSGLTAIHWPSVVNGVDLQEQVRGRENDPEFIADVLAPVFASYTVVGDVPVPALSRVLAERYPTARFVAVHRPAKAWVRSARRHFCDVWLRKARPFAPYVVAVLGRYFSQLPPDISELSDQDLAAFHAWHYRDLEWLSDSGRLLYVSLEDERIGEKICEFCDLPPLALHHREDISKPWREVQDAGQALSPPVKCEPEP